MPPSLPPLAEIAPGLSATGKLDRADIEALAAAGVKTIINNRPDGEDPGQLPASDARALAASHGIAYHHIPVTAATLSKADVDAFADVLKAAAQPVVAHCRSGTRTTLLWSLTQLREGADPLTLINKAAQNGIDIASLPAVAARLRQAGRNLHFQGKRVATEPRWVSVDTVIAFNREIADAVGQPHKVLDAAALRTAVAHPWNVWVYFMDRDIAVLAMRLYTSIVNARAFATANEATALRAAEAFLEANGYVLDLGGSRDHALERLREFSAGRLSQTGVVEWFRLWMTPRQAAATFAIYFRRLDVRDVLALLTEMIDSKRRLGA